MSLIPHLTIAGAVRAHPLRAYKRNTCTMTTCEIDARALRSAAQLVRRAKLLLHWCPSSALRIVRLEASYDHNSLLAAET